MAHSGIEIDDCCVRAHTELQKNHKYRYILFKIDTPELKKVQVHSCVDKSSETHDCEPKERFEEFAKMVMNEECVFAVYDAEYHTPNNVKREKVVFISWCSDKAKIKEKMIYTTTRDSLKKKLMGIHVDIQANDSDDLKWDNVMEKMEKFKK